MVIDCNNKEQVLKLLFSTNVSFLRGSRLYGTNSDSSDYDFGMIVPDDTEFIDIPVPETEKEIETRVHNCVDIVENGSTTGLQLIRECDFIDMIKEHQPFALEAINIDGCRIADYKKYFKMDKWQLRKTYSSIVNNSWAKAKKKMTVEKDIDMYCGVKSLFHSIRLQMMACSYTKKANPYPIDELVKNLHKEIMDDWKSGFTWEDFKTKYKPKFNAWHSELARLCPKPEEEYKNNKNK